MPKSAGCPAELDDPRVANARHDPHDILAIGICILLCGGEDCLDTIL
jgi:hypothetical protein